MGLLSTAVICVPLVFLATPPLHLWDSQTQLGERDFGKQQRAIL